MARAEARRECEGCEASQSGACLAVQRDYCGEEQEHILGGYETDSGQTLPSPQNMNPAVGKEKLAFPLFKIRGLLRKKAQYIYQSRKLKCSF